MFGSKGPGERDVYARRRLLAVLAVLVLLALLVPRACQALLGSNEEAGQGEGQKSGAPGKAAGAGAKNDAGDAGTGNADTGNAEKSDKQNTQDGTSDRGAPFVEDKPGAGGRSGEAGEEAAPDLGVMVANLAVIDGSEEFASSEDRGAAESAPESSETGSEQPISEVQFALAASPAPTQQPSSEPETQQPSSEPETQQSSFEPEPAPGRRPEPEAAAPAAGPAPATLGEQIRDRANRRVTAALAETAALEEVGTPQTAVEPVAPAAPAAPVAAVPVAAVPVAAVPAPPTPAPVAPAPAALAPAAPAPAAPAPAAPAPAAPAPAAPAPAAPTFAPTPAAGALNGIPTVPAVKPNLPAGPRLAAVGPRRTPGPAF
jgi:hypothetical protein